MQIIFLSGTKCLWLSQYVNKILGWLKKLGSAQNILGPVKGQGISASSKMYVPAEKQFYWMQIIFLSGTKFLWLPQYVNKFLVWHKKIGPAQSILGPVKGQSISK